MKIFSTNKADNKKGFYRIIQPLRFLKRSGWEAVTVPFTGQENTSVLPVNNSLLTRLSKGADFILTTIVMEEDEILRLLNLRKHNKCKWIVDVSENVYANPDLLLHLPIIERSLSFADGIVVSTKINKEIYKGLNENIYVLPSALDFNIWDSLKPAVSRKIKIGYFGNHEGIEKITPTFRELEKKYKGIQFVNIFIDGVIGVPEKLAKLGIWMAVFPLSDSNYNRGKNNIDILEMMAMRIPIVASPVVAFVELPVFYCSTNYEWWEAIEALITRKELRKEAGEIGYDYVHKNYDMKRLISPFQSWLKALPRKDY